MPALEIQVHKFFDVNKDTVRQDTEEWAPGVEFCLYDAENNLVSAGDFFFGQAQLACQKTDVDGLAQWINLRPGTYTAKETLPNEWLSTTGTEQQITKPFGGRQDLYFGNVRWGSLKVTKTVIWNGFMPQLTQTFRICIQGPSYPTKVEEGACKEFNSTSGWEQTWADLDPGAYSVTEDDPGSRWIVNVPASAVSVVAGCEATATVTNTKLPPSTLTDSSLCNFDVDDTTLGNQFRLVFPPDPTTESNFKLTASNPGQFYYNVFYEGSGGEDLTITLPYPFVTQGAMPVHVYSDFTATRTNGRVCLVPGHEIVVSPLQVTLSDYDPQSLGSHETIEIALPASLPNGYAYINIHLDYGLKGTSGYVKEPNTGEGGFDAVGTITIVNAETYTFADSSSAPGAGDEVYSTNAFKRNHGIGGLVRRSDTTEALNNIRVEIYKGTSKVPATVYTDEDGWYVWQYRYRGRPESFTIKVPEHNLSQTVTLKSNQFVTVDFMTP